MEPGKKMKKASRSCIFPGTPYPFLCFTCGQAFKTGQALGGHKNCHSNKSKPAMEKSFKNYFASTVQDSFPLVDSQLQSQLDGSMLLLPPGELKVAGLLKDSVFANLNHLSHEEDKEIDLNLHL